MHLETKGDPVTITGTIIGIMAGMYNTWQGNPLLHTVTTTAITAAVSCLVSFLIQRVLKRFK